MNYCIFETETASVLSKLSEWEGCLFIRESGECVAPDFHALRCGVDNGIGGKKGRELSLDGVERLKQVFEAWIVNPYLDRKR